jgi:hypothetical protein
MFATVPDLALMNNFTLAELQLSNRCGSRVKAANVRELLLGLLVAHITALFNGVNGQPPQGVVGRVSQATEGSVSVAIEWGGTIAMAQAYYLQTQWGALYWQSTATYRTMQYVPPRQNSCNGIFPGAGNGIGPVGTGFCGNNGGSS